MHIEYNEESGLFEIINDENNQVVGTAHDPAEAERVMERLHIEQMDWLDENL